MTNLKCIKILVKIDLTNRPEKIFPPSKSPLDLLSYSKHNIIIITHILTI
jgi:hypothetical protein